MVFLFVFEPSLGYFRCCLAWSCNLVSVKSGMLLKVTFYGWVVRGWFLVSDGINSRLEHVIIMTLSLSCLFLTVESIFAIFV